MVAHNGGLMWAASALSDYSYGINCVAGEFVGGDLLCELDETLGAAVKNPLGRVSVEVFARSASNARIGALFVARRGVVRVDA